MNAQDRIYNLIAKKLAGEASADELKELADLLQTNPDASFSMEVLSAFWQQPIPQSEIDKAFARHMERLAASEARPAKEPYRWGKTASRWDRVTSFVTANGRLTGYIKIAWRNLSRSKAFSAINITGLAIGMAGAILILLWIANELSFDQFHTKKDRIYHIYNNAKYNGDIVTWGNTPMVMAPVLRTYPEIESVIRMNFVGAFTLKTADKQLQTHGYLTDPEFLTTFDFPLLKGNTATALSKPRSIVLTETMSKKLFGHTDAMGQTVRIDSNVLFTVTGILKDLPQNTQFNCEYLVPWSYMKEVGWQNDSWTEGSVNTIVVLKPGVTEQTANARLRNMLTTHDRQANGELFLHPMRKWHLWSNFTNGVQDGGQIGAVRLMAVIAAFILLIACINYMNLSTARSVKRAREVGIRKVAGAGRSALVGQFLGESIMIAFIAGLLSLAIANYTLPWFNELTGRPLTMPFNKPFFWLMAVAFVVFTGVLAGSYPAFYLSSFQPVRVLKGTFKAVKALVTPRKVLVVVQFTFAIVLIICTIVVYRQIAYGKKRAAGFDMEQLGFLYNLGNLEKHYPAIREELLHSGVVSAMMKTGSPVTEVWSREDYFNWQGKDPNSQLWFIKYYSDKDFAKTLGLKLVQGRDIDVEKYPSDSTAVLLNEAAMRKMGLKNAIGHVISNHEGHFHVVGVVNNFVPGLPWDPVYPMVVLGPAMPRWFGTVTFRLSGEQSISKSVATIKSVIKKHDPDYPFNYLFVQEVYQSKFGDEVSVGKIAAVFAGLTIFISCLGLFALATYMAENRVKEIGIRKVLGASTAAITALLSKDFLKLVMLAFLIASPLAWWAMQHWLQGYSYRVQIGWWIFVLTGSVSMLIALLTVSYQAIKAALANPAGSLRSE